LTGYAVLFLRGWRGLLAIIHYDSSPVGPYDELAVSILSARGPTVVEMYVNSPASMIGGRAGWGFPKQLARLHCERWGRRLSFRCGNRTKRVRSCGPVFPLRANLWTVQLLEGQRVRVPVSIEGRARLGFQGRRVALILEQFEMTVLPPRASN